MMRVETAGITSAVLIIIFGACAPWGPTRTQPSTVTVPGDPSKTDRVAIVSADPPDGETLAAGANAAVRVEYSFRYSTQEPHVGICLARDPSTVVFQSCRWTFVTTASATLDIKTMIPRIGTQPAFGETRYITSMLTAGRPGLTSSPEPATDVPLTSLLGRQLARDTIARTWQWR